MGPSKYWIKLYHEILHDPKMGRLPDNLWRRTIELFLMAGELDQDGELPAVSDMAWTLRVSEQELEQELEALAASGLEIVTRTPSGWIVTRFADRQSAMSSAERTRRHRESKRKEEYYGDETDESQECNEDVTDRPTDSDIDSEEEGGEAPPPPVQSFDYLDHVGGLLQDGLAPGVSDPSQDHDRHKRYKNPFCQIYYQRTGLHPESKVQRPAIEALMLDEKQDEKLWEQIIVKWLGLGWSKRNVDGMLDYYHRREVPSTKPSDNGAKPRASPDPPSWAHDDYPTEQPDFLK